MEAWKEKQGQEYLKAAKDKVAGLRYPVFIGIIALLVLWAGSLEQQASAVEVASKKLKQIQYIRYNYKRTQDIKQNQRSSKILALDEIQKSPSDPLPLGIQEDLLRLSDISKIKTDTLTAQVNRQLKSVQFELFGIKLATPPQWAAPLWLLFGVGLLFFLQNERAEFYSLAGRGLRLLRNNNEPLLAEQLLLYSSPMWLAPQPKNDGSAIGGAQAIQTVMGWGLKGERARWRILFVIFIASTLLFARVTWIGLCTALTLPGYPFLIVDTIIAVLFLLFLISLGIMVRWLVPMEVDDDHTEATLIDWIHDSKDNQNRRIFIKFLAAGIVLGIAADGSMLWGANRFMASVKDLVKRIRKPRSPLGLKTKLVGFYKNPKSQTLHYIHDGQLFQVSPQTKLALFEQVKIPQDFTQLCQATFVRSIEAAALRSYKDGNPELACIQLINAISQASKTNRLNHVIRLIDLCAGIAVRRGLPSYISQLVEILNINKTTSVQFQSSIEKWIESTGNWQTRWKSPKKIKWANMYL